MTHGLGVPLKRRWSESDIAAFIAGQPSMMRVLLAVAGQHLPDGWVGAGFVRNAVWDALHGLASPRECADVDVVFFDPSDASPERDAGIEADLVAGYPDVPWSVRNQARMHARNGDAPYADTRDALRHWPERCTAIAARASGNRVELLAPLGVDDLVGLIVRPTPAFAGKMNIYRQRVQQKNWLRLWPRLQIFEVISE